MKLISIASILITPYAILIVCATSLDAKSKLLQTNNIEHADYSPIRKENQLSPVILMPGDGGSRLQAKLDRQNVAHHYCERKSTDWFDLWLNLSLLVPFALDCWVDK